MRTGTTPTDRSKQPTRIEHQRELDEARVTIQALVSGQVDTVSGPSGAVLLAAADALRAAEERYRILLDSAPDAMVVFNDRGEILMLNSATQELFGWSAEELIGHSVDVLLPEDARTTYAEAGAAYFGSPRPLRLGAHERMYCRRADGTDFPVEISLNPAQTGEGTQIIAAIRDIAARVETEDALRESEAQLASTLNSIGDGVLATDLQGVVTRINPIAAQVIGFSREEAIGRRVDEVYRVLSESTHQPLITPIAGLATGGVSVAPNARLLTRDGRERVISQSAAPIRKPTGEVMGVVLAFRDITAQKEMQDQLHLSDRMVSLGTLAAGVAHEINNPLAALIGNLDILMEDLAQRPVDQSPLPAIIDDVLLDVREAAEQVRLIVKDLKVFSRSDEESRGPVDVQRLLDSSLRLARNEVRHRARLVKEWYAVPPVIANEARLGEVFVNLIVNAAQAIPDGHADENEIRLITRLQDDGRVVIEVRDTGLGISPEIRARVFDPFFTTKPVGVGTGLGLSICHRIVTELGGEIAIDSVVGEGTTLRVTLPAGPAEQVPLVVVSPRQNHVQPRRASVLVIDDELLVRGFVRRALAPDHDVILEACAEEALLRFQRGERFDVILCDVMMPQTTGLELYDLLSAVIPGQAERLVFMTGGAFTGTIQHVLDATGVARLDKPFGAEGLRAVVDQVLASGAKGNRNRTRPMSPSSRATPEPTLERLTPPSPKYALPRIAPAPRRE